MRLSRRALIQGAAALPFLTRSAFAQRELNVLRFGLSAFPPNLQPWVNTGAASGTVKMLVNRSLVAYDAKGELRGELATSWSIDGDGAWVFKLRQDAVFHNGEPVTADDVKWSIEQIAAEKSTAFMRTQFQNVTRIEVPDAQTVRLVTKEPLAVVPTWFANYNTFIISRKSAANESVGCGPFRIVAQERGTSIDLEAFDKFYKKGVPQAEGHQVHRLCRREPAQCRARRRRRRHHRIRAVAVNERCREQSQAEA